MNRSGLTRRDFVGIGAAGLTLAATTSFAGAAKITSDIDAATLGKSKTTPLGLYLSPTAAHQAMQQNPEILMVDVRDPIEIMFVGHAEGLSKIIPLRMATHTVDPKTGQYKMKKNKGLIADFEALLAQKGKTKSDPLFVTCRSGGRSAKAATLLIENGFTNVWNLTEGFEGDKNDDGVRALNGWRNAGLPWGYKLAPGVAWTRT